MQKQRSWIIAMLLISACSTFGNAQVQVKRQLTLMGSIFEITVVDQDSAKAQLDIDLAIEEITRIENLISEWRPGTQVSEVNRNAGLQPVKVDKEVFDLTKRAIDYSKMTGGAFDISIAAMDQLWQYDGSMTEMPDAAAVRRSVEHVGYRDIILDSVNTTIYLARRGMKIGFGSIGKGYAADKGRAILQAKGIMGGIVNASGDLSAWGEQISGKPWAIGINNPFKTRKLLKVIKIRSGSIATSGSYEKYAEIDGKRYSHIINPKTGYPSTGLTSVTIIGPSAEFANFLSTSAMVLGEKEGVNLINRFSEYKYFLVSDTSRVIKSRRF